MNKKLTEYALNMSGANTTQTNEQKTCADSLHRKFYISLTQLTAQNGTCLLSPDHNLRVLKQAYTQGLSVAILSRFSRGFIKEMS